jgi:hypothetical protein
MNVQQNGVLQSQLDRTLLALADAEAGDMLYAAISIELQKKQQILASQERELMDAKKQFERGHGTFLIHSISFSSLWERLTQLT